jgi:hypothetical protein
MALTIVTNPVTVIATTTATCGGNSITGTITGSITAKGVCWSTTVNPVASGSHIDANLTTYPSNTNFPSAITSLTTGTTYYVRAYVTDGSGTYYGANVVFTTLGLTTAAALSITSTTATSGATSISGFTSISAVGVCWSTTTTPTTSNNHTNDVITGNSFTSYLTGLTPGTTYYVRAYIISGGTTYYATQITFTTTTSSPVVTTTSAITITSTTADPNGNVVSLGGTGLNITKRGVCYSTSSTGIDITVSPSSFPTQVSQTGTYSTGAFTGLSSITGLTAGTTYYYRAYAINSSGSQYAYGEQKNFTTLGGPTVETIIPYSITSSTAQVGCNILTIGGSSLTARGVVISTIPGVTIATGTVYTDLYSGNGTQYLTKLTGLTKDTTYYIKAYATNAQGTGYGEELIFSTTSCNPLVEECNPQEYPVVECSDPACEYIIPLECVIGETTPPQCTNLTPEDPTLLSSLIKINEVLCSLSTRDFAIYILGTIINNPNMNTIFCNVDDSSCRT